MLMLVSLCPSIPADNTAALVPATATTESDEESMVMVTPKRDYYITKVKFTRPVEETYQAASAELVIAKII